MLIILKFICLVVGIVYGFSNTVKAIVLLRGGMATISKFQLLLMALGIVGFIFLQFKLYL